MALTTIEGHPLLQTDKGEPQRWDVEVPAGYRARGRLSELDADFGLALFSLDRPAPVDFMELSAVGLPAINEPWSALYRPGWSQEAAHLRGIIAAVDTAGDSGHLILRLSVEDLPPEPEEALGTPLLVGDQIIGLVVDVGPGHGVWAALPLRGVTQSSIYERVRLAEDFDERALFGRLSPSSRDALAHADGIRRHMNQEAVHMEHLIAGLYYAKDVGPTRQVFASVTPPIDPQELVFIAQGVVEAELPVPSRYKGLPLPGGYNPSPSLTALPPLSKHARSALHAANQVAFVNSPSAVRSRHLLFGALTIENCSVIKALRERGVQKETVPLDDDQAQPVGPELPIERHGPMIAGFQADDLRANDRLGVTEEVKALCSVIAAKDVPLPMAIGIFGPWGSGKSYFMGKMEEQINAIKDRARAAGPDTSYHSHIVQLKFNAWHYIDTNLWATLGSELFERLSWAVTPPQTQNADYERAVLRAREDAARAELVNAEKKKYDAEARLRTAESKLKVAQAPPSATALARETYRAVFAVPEVADTARNAAESINLPAGNAAELGTQLLELAGLWGRVRLVALSIRNSQARLKWLAVLAAFLLTPVLLTVVVPALANLGLNSTVARLVSLLVGIVGVLSPFVPKVKETLDRFQAFVNEVERARQTEIQQLQTQRDAIEVEVVETTKAIVKAKESLDDIEKAIVGLSADQRMADWIRQRKLSHDYTKHLGVVATARDDFEQLSIHLDAVRNEAETQSANQQEPNLLPRIDRIVLYIDDLDRCPERVVEEVLQAVHLLLAFPIFIVVVGVDPRWLLHALRRRSPAFRPRATEAESLSPLERRHWLSTPLNYLEKIFQIPFTLRPLDEPGFAGLIQDLAKPQREETSQDNQTGPESGTEAVEPFPATDETGPFGGPAPTTGGEKTAEGETRETTEGSLSDEKVSPPPPNPTEVGGGDADYVDADAAPRATEPEIDPNPSYLIIGSWEQSFMGMLFPLIPSPRAAKRFVNVYRLLKAMEEPRRPETFRDSAETGEFRELLLLLALQTGYPAEAANIFRELLDEEDDSPWWEFILRPRAYEGDVVPAMDDGTGHWEDLRHALQQVHSLISAKQAMPEKQPCATFKKWAPTVARFSFHSGQALLTS